MLGSSRSIRRKPKGITIRPEAVRQARMEKGLSLSELAGGEITRAAIHQVETGKMRPSMRTLELIARRTGRPVSYFMVGQEGSEEQQASRDELSRLVDSGEYREAVTLGTRILAGDPQPGIEADVQFCVGRALVRTGDGTRALPHLTRAHQLFERLGDAWMIAHVLDQEAVALFLLEDPRTLPAALEALERCEQLDPPAPALQASILNSLGNIHLRGHDWRNAARFFEMGLTACEELVSLRLAARLNDGLSLARQRLGDFSGALRSAERAFALYAVDTDVVGLIRAENNLGYVLLRQGKLDAASTHLYRALELCDEHDIQRRGRAHVLNSIGELHLARREPGLACTHLLRALEVATGLGERDSEATARHLLGSAYLQLDDEGAAHGYFSTAIDLLEQLDLRERLRSCATEYAELLYARGRYVESIAYWRIAAGALEPAVADSPVEVGLTGEAGA
jgi:tetratricopeptide (TPR) repeat protein